MTTNEKVTIYGSNLEIIEQFPRSKVSGAISIPTAAVGISFENFSQAAKQSQDVEKIIWFGFETDLEGIKQECGENSPIHQKAVEQNMGYGFACTGKEEYYPRAEKDTVIPRKYVPNQFDFLKS